MDKFLSWLITIGSALSQLLYVVITFGNNSNLSICGEVYYYKDKKLIAKVLYPILNTIFFKQKDHCQWAYNNDLKYAKWYIERDKNKSI